MLQPYRHLDLDERRTIFRLLGAKVPVAVIAARLGRHRSTIHREIHRNHFHQVREYAGTSR
jgi:IS30 family transposase